MLDLGTSVPSQIISLHLLAEIDRVREERRASATANFHLVESHLHDLLPTWSWSAPRGSLTLWVRLPSGSARELATVARQRGVAILPGPTTSCDLSFDDHIRLTIARPADVLAEGIRRLAAAWGDYLPRAEGGGAGLEVIV
ncbi:MAG TPA: hypothetical protein VFW71_10935 [Actinomycetota bacterium]|nr:hypothetical protein [Actinomycetota bacterium]